MTDKAKQLIKALRVRCAEQSNCNNCPKLHYCRFDGDSAIRNEAADLIESLEAERDSLAERCRQLEARNDALIAKEVLFDEAIAAGAKMQRERDAAVEDVAKLKRCEHCIGYEEFLKPDGNIERCNECEERSNWQWRGVKED